MSQYKDTLNLPQTSFPMKANLANKEPKILESWRVIDLYRLIRNKKKGAKTFILHDGPPYANGNLHLGHAVNKIIKDIIIKSKSLSGYDVPFIPGWDCHGLPIEHKVEGKIKKKKHKYTAQQFRQKCREYATSQIEIQKKDFIRMGIIGDWDNPYLTMNYETEANIIRALGATIKNGHVIKGYKPVYWSVVGKSALAEAEVEYQNKISTQLDVRYQVVDEDNVISKFKLENSKGEGELSIVIWTTTPWTLPSSQAVSVSPDLEYIIIQCQIFEKPARLIIANELLKKTIGRLSIQQYKIIGSTLGKNLENVSVKHPFYDKTLPVILGNHVTTEAGTGCVHTAPDHGVDDFNVAKRYKIETLNYVDDSGVFTKNVQFFAGMHVYKVDKNIIEVLQKNKRLLAYKEFEHSYPHCWRTKTPLIFRATPQWFISMKKNNLLDKSFTNMKNVKFTPNWGRNRMEAMLSQSPDWCISRQRVWGVPITLLINKQTEELHPNTQEIIEKVADLVEKQGIEAWYNIEIHELIPENEKDKYYKVTDTLDVWFDSGVTHYSVLSKHKDLHFPANLYVEGSDQHRGWFQSSLKTSMAINNKAPYKHILTHGFVVDGDGKKMSKSLGNIISPQKIFDSFGADILRLWVASSDYSTEITVSDEILKRNTDSYRRMRNTARYLLSNLSGFNPNTDEVAWENMLSLDQWVLSHTAITQENIIQAYEQYNFVEIVQTIQNFSSIVLGGFYLDIIKDRQYTTQKDSLARKSCQTAMFHMIKSLAIWLAPICTFTADEIWKSIPGDKSQHILLETWHKKFSKKYSINIDWPSIIKIKQAVNKSIETARNNNLIGGSLEAEISLHVDEKWEQILTPLSNELKFVFITSKAILKPLDDCHEGLTITTDIEGLKIQVSKSKYEKCERCWHRNQEVGTIAEHPSLCKRCVTNIDGNGEIRKYA